MSEGVPASDAAGLDLLPRPIATPLSAPHKRARGAGRPTICLLVLSAVADDPRVRRQGEAFHQAGWDVVAVGLPGARSPAPEWRIVMREDIAAPTDVSAATATPPQAADSTAPPPGLRPTLRRWTGRLPPPLRIAWRWVVGQSYEVRYRLRLLAVRVRPQIADRIYWSYSSRIRDLYDCAKSVRAQVWLANDWSTLPIAARLSRELGGVYGYDTHEFAVEEYGDQTKWRLFHQPMVRSLEGAFIGDAAVVSAVSSGIAERLEALYCLPAPTLVVRNTPGFEEVPFRATRDRIHVLYHGLLVAGRGLEATIDSLANWRPEFDLTIRGPGTPAYLGRLRQLAERHGVADRVHLVPPLPMTELVRAAAAFDIGFFALPGSSRHNQFALPNKLFEYMMAGLALCVTELPEMARLIRQYDAGIMLPRATAGDITTAINSLDRARIDRYKHNALAAARDLCWERELARLVATYQRAIA